MKGYEINLPNPPDVYQSTEINDHEAKSQYRERVREALAAVWQTAFTQFEIASALGLVNEPRELLEPRQIGQLTTERDGIREEFSSHISASLIKLGVEYTEVEDTTPEDILDSIDQWSDDHLRAIFIDEISRPGEISEYDRFSLLTEEVRQIYGALCSNGAEKGITTLDLSFRIALRAKTRIGLGWFTHFAYALDAFNVCKTDHIYFDKLFRHRGEDPFVRRSQIIRSQIEKRKAYDRLEPQIVNFLQSMTVFGTELTYMDLYRRVNGHTETGRRWSILALAREHDTYPAAMTERYKRIEEAVLTNSLSPIGEVFHVSGGSTPIEEDEMDRHPIMYDHREIARRRLLGKYARKLKVIEAQFADEAPGFKYYREAELIMNIHVLEAAIEDLRSYESTRPSETQDADKVALLVMEKLRGLVRDEELDPLSAENFQFSEKFIGAQVIRKLLYQLTETSVSMIDGKIRIGQELRDRYIAAMLLRKPYLVHEQLLHFARLKNAGMSAKEIGTSFPLSPTGVSSVTVFLALESLLSSGEETIERKIMEQLMNTSSSLGSPQNSEELKAFMDQSLRLLRVVGPKGKGRQEIRDSLIPTTVKTIEKTRDLRLCGILLGATFLGASCRDIARALSDDPASQQNLFTPLSETKRVFSHRPVSKKGSQEITP